MSNPLLLIELFSHFFLSFSLFRGDGGICSFLHSVCSKPPDNIASFRSPAFFRPGIVSCPANSSIFSSSMFTPEFTNWEGKLCLHGLSRSESILSSPEFFISEITSLSIGKDVSCPPGLSDFGHCDGLFHAIL